MKVNRTKVNRIIYPSSTINDKVEKAQKIVDENKDKLAKYIKYYNLYTNNLTNVIIHEVSGTLLFIFAVFTLLSYVSAHQNNKNISVIIGISLTIISLIAFVISSYKYHKAKYGYIIYGNEIEPKFIDLISNSNLKKLANNDYVVLPEIIEDKYRIYRNLNQLSTLSNYSEIEYDVYYDSDCEKILIDITSHGSKVQTIIFPCSPEQYCMATNNISEFTGKITLDLSYLDSILN